MHLPYNEYCSGKIIWSLLDSLYRVNRAVSVNKTYLYINHRNIVRRSAGEKCHIDSSTCHVPRHTQPLTVHDKHIFWLPVQPIIGTTLCNSHLYTRVLISPYPDPTEKKNNWKVAIFSPTRRSMLSRRPGWKDNLLIFFFFEWLTKVRVWSL